MPDAPQARPLDQVEEYYDQRWGRRPRFNAPRILRHRAVVRLVRRYRPEGAETTLLDLGCGPGHLAHRLSRFGWVTGVDVSRATLEGNRRRFPSLEFRWGDVGDPGLADELGTFSVVVTSEVAEHVELGGRRAFFDNLAGLVAPGGLLVLTTPDLGALEEAGLPVEDDQPVNNLFRRDELEAWLEDGFELLERRAVHPAIRHRWADLAWKALFLPLGYHGVGILTGALGLPGSYQVLALRRRGNP